jgi:hypothetical protein
MEEWKDVRGYEGMYLVSNMGRVKSVERTVSTNTGKRRIQEKVLLPMMTDNGYWTVCLSRDGASRRVSVHRLVAEAFIPNPDNLPMVNHKDECGLNNAVENLEWCTAKYNSNYGTVKDRISEKNGKPVCRFDLETGEILEVFRSMSEAESTGLYCRCLIRDVCQGVRPHHKGYGWRFVNEADAERGRMGEMPERLRAAVQKGVRQLEIGTGRVLGTFDSVAQAARSIYPASGSHIGCCCNGTRKSCGGYMWEWL